jgi:hypothetical protein
MAITARELSLPLCVWAARSAKVAFGAAGLALAGITLASYNEVTIFQSLAESVVRGETFDDKPISALLSEYDTGCDATLSNRATLSLYVAARAPGLMGAAELDTAHRTIVQALRCAPGDPFLWYGLFWAERKRGEPNATNRSARFLERSYQLGPTEGWISFWRAEDAIPVFNELSPGTRERVQAEFLALAREFPSVAARIVTKVDDLSRARLLTWTEALPLSARQQLAADLDVRGATVDVPGVTYRDGRVAPERKRGTSDID